MIRFGEALRNIRKQLKLTQKDVYFQLGINEDTLRKIENGKVIPKYETIELLSTLYKQDLLKTLMDHRSSNVWYDILNKLDFWIVNDQFRELKSLYESIPQTERQQLEMDLIDCTQLEQFELYLSAALHYCEKTKSFEEILQLHTQALCVTHTSFDPNALNKSAFNFFELRILLAVGIIYAELDQISMSNTILEFVYAEISSTSIISSDTRKLLIRTVYNISYNRHILDNQDETLKWANLGIEQCLKDHSTYFLANLYFRKAAAEYSLGQANSSESFHNSFFVLNISNQQKKAELFKEMAILKYGL